MVVSWDPAMHISIFWTEIRRQRLEHILTQSANFKTKSQWVSQRMLFVLAGDWPFSPHLSRELSGQRFSPILIIQLFSAITTTVSVYRGKSSMYEYIIAGATTGAMYKFNLGLRGIAAGTIVGGVLGTLGGAVSLLLLKSTGTTMEEVRYWQYKWRSNRDENINEGFKTQIKGTERDDPLISQHDEKPQVGNDKLDLKILIPDEPAKEEQVASKKT